MSNLAAAALARPESDPSSARQPSTWRINHTPDAGGPVYVTAEPTATARASFLRIGVTITEMYDGPLEVPHAPNGQGFSVILRERARVASVILTTLENIDHLKDEPHWRREIANIRQLVADIAKHLNGSR